MNKGKRERFRRPLVPRRIPLDAEVRRALEERRLAFREKFGRDLGPDDPIFFEPDTDEPRPAQEDVLVGATVQAMKEAGIDPAKIYAFEKTGMLITDENIERWSEDDLDEWNAAIREFEEALRHHGRPRSLSEEVQGDVGLSPY